MANNYFKSYIWLLETLQSRGPLTLAQIRQLWKRSSVNELGSELPARLNRGVLSEDGLYNLLQDPVLAKLLEEN